MLYVIKFCYAWLLPPGIFLLALLLTCLVFRKSLSFKKLLPVLLLVYLLSISAVSDRLIKPLEDCYPQPALSELQDAEAIVILGGGYRRGVPDFDGAGQVADRAANRYLMGLRLYRSLRVPVILSGGLVYEESGTGPDNVSRLLMACGVPEKDIIPDAKSRNTADNAKYTGEICQARGFHKIVLVTSAHHIPRSVALFRREGIDVIPYPCNYMTHKVSMVDAFAFTPNQQSLNNSAAAIKNYLGILAVKAGLQ